MLGLDQFVASKALNEGMWLDARRKGVTATQVAKAASGPGGFEQAVQDYVQDYIEQDNPYMAFGRAWEPVIAMDLKYSHGIMPNDWLLANSEFPHHLATPDGLSLDHMKISEIKTTGKDWGEGKIPIQYRRQVQWQLHVTGAEVCVFAWMLREENEGVFVPAWFDSKVILIEPDAEIIEQLIETAEGLWERVNNG